ncbi:MAG: polysaccharide deacetylase family protein [Kurthia sp.]|nr:polysaccharide deacetylase family protein [Candidatus Kurthia equi]
MNQLTSKRRLLIDSLLACAFLALVIFAIVYLFIFNKSSEKVIAAEPEQVSTVKTNDKFVQTISLQKNSHQGNYIIKYPKTTSTKLNKAVKESVSMTKKSFLSKSSKNSTLYVDYKFIKHKKLYSFVLTQKVLEGTAFKEKNISTFIVNSENKELLTLSDIIPSEKKLATITSMIEKNFAKDSKVIAYNSKHKKKLKIDPRPISFKNIALSNTNLYFFFRSENYTMPFDETIRVAIPLDKIQNSLAKNLQKPKIKKTATQEANKTEKYVALTFDDGPNATSTKKILATLKKEKVPATFFILGQQAKAYPAIVKQIYTAGHELGNHSYSHPDLSMLNEAKIKSEINLTNKYIQAASGHKPTVFRPPYGARNDQVTKLAKLPTVLWTVDTLDWQNHQTKSILANINAEKSKYTIVLMHDIHMTSAEALPYVIEQLKKDHYTFVTASEMLAIQNNTK